jgi:hypothetical protein
MNQNDWTVFSSTEMPKRLFRVNTTLAATDRNIGRSLEMARRNMAMQIAEKIVSDREFFYMDSQRTDSFVRLSANAVVLTDDEWRTAMEEQFKRGMEAGRSLASWPDMVTTSPADPQQSSASSPAGPEPSR